MKGIIKVNEINIRYSKNFASLTDMCAARGGDRRLIGQWMQNYDTIKFLKAIEIKKGNDNFNDQRFLVIKTQVIEKTGHLGINQWCEETNAKYMKAVAGRYGGTYAILEIALKFAGWLDAEFSASFLIEYVKLLEEKYGPRAIDQQVKRRIATLNYKVMTKAIKENLLQGFGKAKGMVYANEADMLNTIVFGFTAKEYKLLNPNAQGNLRDTATATELWLLSNLETLNAEYIQMGWSRSERLNALEEKILQMEGLDY